MSDQTYGKSREFSHRASENCGDECQSCQDAKALARDLTAEQSKIATLTARCEALEAEVADQAEEITRLATALNRSASEREKLLRLDLANAQRATVDLTQVVDRQSRRIGAQNGIIAASESHVVEIAATRDRLLTRCEGLEQALEDEP